jgi:DNA end-binding protein Ku
MAPRANWKGYLKLSLVSCPIALYPVSSSSERISFRQINKRTGNRLKQQLVDSVTGDVIDAEDKGRGYEVGKNEFLLIEDEELDAIQVEGSHTIDIQQFVPRAQIDKRYYDSPYYIAPDDPVGAEAFAVIREAMKAEDRVALGRVVISKRERVIALEPFENGLLGMTLRYPYEVRAANAYFDEIPDVKISTEMLDLAKHILETKAGDFEPEQFEDTYQNAVVELIRSKKAGSPERPAAPVATPGKVVNIMDALRRSLEQEKLRSGAAAPPTTKVSATAKKGRKRAEGQTEMLLPIAGAKGKESAAKPAVQPKSRQKKAG